MTQPQPPLEVRQERAWKNSNIQNEPHSNVQDYFGHKLRKKKQQTMRVLVCNPNGLTGPLKVNKLERIQQKAIGYELDVLCLTEHNQNLKRLPIQHHIKHITQGWWQHRRAAHVHNKHFDSQKEQQVGGVSIIAVNSIAHRSSSITHDPTGLGRWTSMLINGKQGFSTRIICVYRPCKSAGPDTAYIQQALYFNRIGRKGDPRRICMEDLATAITIWQEAGEKIILVGDFNTGDLNTRNKLSRFWSSWLDKLGLTNVHQQFSTTHDIPSTHERGKVQIDYMFISQGLTVKRAGFLPFSKFPGDHRALWMDIDLKDIIGLKSPPLSTANARRLILQDPRIVKKYLDTLKTKAEAKDIFDRVEQLSNIPCNQWTLTNTSAYQQLSLEFREIMLLSEKSCRKFKTGTHPWSPTLDKARRTKFYWELRVKHLLGLHVPMRKILKLQKKLSLQFSPMPLQALLEKQSNSRREYRQVKRHSMRYRMSFREDLASAIAVHRQVSNKSVIRELINREEAREMHRRIKWMRNKSKNMSTSGVLISKSNGTKQLVSDKTTLEKVIMMENERKFHQTEDQCPLTKDPLLSDIGIYATGPAVPFILAGTYKPPSGTNKATASFLKACTIQSNSADQNYNHLSYDHYCRAWSRAKEKTGSGVVHFGHWKAGIQDSVIAQTEWLLTTLPLQHGFSPTVWQKATDVMILKQQGVLDLHKLRTIVLYEADFNFLNKCIGRQVMDTAMANGGMAAEQYAKPGSSAQEQCLTRRLIFDLVRYTRQALAMASSDLKSCYDRIVHAAAALAMQKNGLSQQAVTTMFETIQQCRHHIRTAYGDSECSYGGQGTYKLPPMGAGQGNGAGPQMWSILSSVLFMAMQLEGLSTTFCQKMTKKVLSITGFMYVDDMDLIRLRDNIDSHLLTEDLQLTLTYWNKLIKVTGGAIEPNKSGWYAFQQRWNTDTGSYQYEDIGNTGEVTARDKDGAKVSLPYISCHSAQQMLGVKMTPTGNQDEQIASMMEKAKEEAQFLKNGNISDFETRHAVVSSIFPRLSWSLPCMSLSPEDSKKLFRPILLAALPKMGIVTTLGYDYIHGSAAFQGLGIPELFHSGYSDQIQLLMDHVWRSTQTGHFLQMLIQEFIIENGSSQSPLLPTSNSRLGEWNLTENTWFASLRAYIVSHHLRIELPIPLLVPLRYNDISIMDFLDTAPQFNAATLKEINVCRLYKRVTFLSEIVTGDGTRITTDAGTDRVNDRPTRYQYNHQHYPTDKQWKSWKNAINFINQSTANRLHQPLGHWTVEKEEYIKYWDYFYNTTRNTLLHQVQAGQWMEYTPIATRTRQLVFNNRGVSIPFPVDVTMLCRTTITFSNGIYTADGFSQHNIQLTATPTETNGLTSAELVRALCHEFSDSSWAVKFFEASPSIENLLTDFSLSKAIMVGDGSYNDTVGLGSGACIVSSANGLEYIIIGGPTPGPRDTQSPYRSEVGTIVGMGILSHALSSITHSGPSVVIACDNDNALECPFLPATRLSSKQSSADLITLAHDIWKQSAATPIPTRVKGHADEHKQELSLIERLNCLVDEKAKHFLSLRPHQELYRLGGTKYGLPHVSYKGVDITGRVSQTIQSLQALQRSINAGIRTGQLNLASLSMIDFRAIARSSSLMSTYKKIFRTKWVSKQLPLGSVMKQRKHRICDNCPTCLQTNEDLSHFISCPSPEAIQEYSKCLEKLLSWMQQVDTDPIICHHLISVLSVLRHNQNCRPLPYPCILTKHIHREAFKSQETIGWVQFTQGILSWKWASLQQEYYTAIQSRRNGIGWAAQLISQLWDINLQMWLFRNNQLHSNKILLQQLHGQEYLDIAIEQEFCRGRGNLPSPFSPFFSKYTQQQLLELQIDSKIEWFRTIRTAREDIGSDIHDDFSTNPALRGWIGLRPI